MNDINDIKDPDPSPPPNDIKDPDPSPPPPEKPSVKQEAGLDNEEDEEDDASIWSGPSWWSWGPSVISSDQEEWAQEVWHVPEVYGPGYNGGGPPGRDSNYDILDADYDILEDRMSQGDYDILVGYYKNNE